MDAPLIPPAVPLERRRDQLAALIAALGELADLLNSVPGRRWAVHFEACLDRARILQRDGFTQEDLNALSGSVRYAYGGMGSFSDYVPVEEGPEAGTWIASEVNDRLTELSGRVWRLALDLMVVGDR